MVCTMRAVTFQRARSEEQRAARRQAILHTAEAMLAEMPVAALSLNELSRRVGLAKSNVLRYFESREAVLLELLDAAWREWLDALAVALPPSDAAVPVDERIVARIDEAAVGPGNGAATANDANGSAGERGASNDVRSSPSSVGGTVCVPG